MLSDWIWPIFGTFQGFRDWIWHIFCSFWGFRAWIWPTWGAEGLALAHFGFSGPGFGPLQVLIDCVWPIFGIRAWIRPIWVLRDRIWPMLGVQGLDLAHFGGSLTGFEPFWVVRDSIWPILGIQGLDLNHFGCSGTGFGPFYAHFGCSGTGFEQFWGFKDWILTIFCLDLAHYRPIWGF